MGTIASEELGQDLAEATVFLHGEAVMAVWREGSWNRVELCDSWIWGQRTEG